MTHHPLYVGKRMSNERGYRISLSMKRTKQAKELFRGKPYFNLKCAGVKLHLVYSCQE